MDIKLGLSIWLVLTSNAQPLPLSESLSPIGPSEPMVKQTKNTIQNGLPLALRIYEQNQRKRYQARRQPYCLQGQSFRQLIGQWRRYRWKHVKPTPNRGRHPSSHQHQTNWLELLRFGLYWLLWWVEAVRTGPDSQLAVRLMVYFVYDYKFNGLWITGTSTF